ncbi:MAG: 50S ribosomal protein L18 [Candidatus Paceibacterota bacterium]
MKTKTQVKTNRRVARHKRIRAKVIGTATKPRLAVFKSNLGIYAQLIDDQAGHTLVAADARKVKGDTPLARAEAVGQQIAEMAKPKKIEEVVFDRGGFLYSGAVKAVAEGARSSGLKF